MRQKFLLLLAITFGAVYIFPVFGVFAQVDEGGDDPVSNEETAEEPDEILQTTSVEGSEGSEGEKPTKEERRAAREARFAEKFDTARTNRVAGRCAGAQGLLTGVTNASEAMKSTRTAAHDRLVGKLNKIVERLQVSEIDTATLETQIGELQTLIDTFNTKFDEHQTALADATELDCEADTEGFLLALEEAKSLRKELRAASKDIREYVVDNIISTLNDIKTSLGDDSEEDTDAEEN